MKQSKQIQKLVLSASLVAVSVVIDVFFKSILNIQNFGVPFYAIPLILGSIILGPGYGLMMGFVSDLAGFMILPSGTYSFIFAFGAMLWGFLPGLFLYKKYQTDKLMIIIPVTHIFVTIANTIGLLAFLTTQTALASLVVRVGLIPVNSIIMAMMIKSLYHKILPVIEQSHLEPQKLS